MFQKLTTIALTTLMLTGPGPSEGRVGNRITILYDAFGKPSAMQKDWGFAALVEYDGKRILFDTGNNAEIFAHNVKAKGIDLTRLDFAVISHRHGDHVGGLAHLLDKNPDLTIYAPQEGYGIFGAELPSTFYRRSTDLPPEMRYFDGKPAATLRFGAAWPGGRFRWVGETTEIAPGIHVIAIKGSWGADLPLIELSLALDTPAGIVLVVGCSHPTIEKIVEAAAATIDKPIHLVIGGTHLLPAPDEEIRRIATALREHWKVKWIAPAHCTGEPAFTILRETFGANYLYAGLGTEIGFGLNPVVETDPGAPYRTFGETELLTYRGLSAAEPQHPRPSSGSRLSSP